MTDADREIARKRIKSRRDFVATTVILVVVGAFLVVVWNITTGGQGYFWPMWPLIAFAIAIVVTGLDAFGLLKRGVSDRAIDAEIARMNRRSGAS